MLGNSISGVIFDLDSTLADTSPDIASALNAALRDTGQTPLLVPVAAPGLFPCRLDEIPYQNVGRRWAKG